MLYRAQVRYEEDLRGLQGIQTTLKPAPISPTNQAGPPSSSTSPPAQPFSSPSGEYFPRVGVTDKSSAARRNSLKFPGGATSSTARPLAIRTRLNSLTARSLNSPQRATSSSVATLQGPKRHLPLHVLASASSRASAIPFDDESSEDDDESRKLEEEEKQAEEQAALEQKLKDLTLKLTKEHIGLVSSPPRNRGKRKDTDRGRERPWSISSSASLQQQIHMSRRHSHTPSHHSLSSTSSPQGSIPSIPSPSSPGRSQPPSPMARHLSPVGKSNSPPAIAYNNAWAMRPQPPGRTRTGGQVRSDIGSEIGSTDASLSDLSGASLRLLITMMH